MGAPEPAPDSVPHEWIDAEITVAGLDSPADEQKLGAALAKLGGIKKFSITEGKLVLEYGPITITKARLVEIIAQSAYRVGEVESGPASAIADALHPEPSG